MKKGNCEYCGSSFLSESDGIINNRVSVVAFSDKGIILVEYSGGSVMLPGGSKIRSEMSRESVRFLRELLGINGYNPVKLFEYDGHYFFRSKGRTRNRHHVFFLTCDEENLPQIRSRKIKKIFEWDPLTPVPSICTSSTQSILLKIKNEYINPATGKPDMVKILNQ
ncbi:MAG: hypothetical protein GX362_00165 [Methanosarcinaceae archaeon]|nr:hypothetical protein [Methanosarcinaceae archaeon]